MEQIMVALFTMTVGVLGCIGYFFGSNRLLDRIYPADGTNAVSNLRRDRKSVV